MKDVCVMVQIEINIERDDKIQVITNTELDYITSF